MNLKTLTLAVATAAVAFSCNQFKMTKTEAGDRYQLHESGKSDKKPKDGDIISFDLVIKSSSNDTLVITDTYKMGQPVTIALRKGPFAGSFENGLYNLSEGDSATIYVSADSLYTMAQQPLPPGIEKGSDLLFTVKLHKIKTADEYTKELDDKKNNEGKIIDEYVGTQLKGATKGNNGIYYVVTKTGGGASVAAGDTVTVHYKGTLLNGTEFDSSIGGEPIKFPVGMGYVIPGWEQTLMDMKPGEKRTVVIPSDLAYGANGAGNQIDPFSPLRFEIELVDVSKGKK